MIHQDLLCTHERIEPNKTFEPALITGFHLVLATGGESDDAGTFALGFDVYTHHQNT